MAGVVFDKVNKVYDNGFHAVHDLDLEVQDGEFMVLVGPSGCGKSTALRMVAGLEDISSGRLLIGDKVVNTVPSKDRDIAMVFQSYALYPHMSVRDNIGYGLRLRKTPKDEITRLVDAAAAKLDLTDYLDRRPKQLSGGQRQRVAMGRAIVRRPQVFLMDEPLSNLDAKLRGQMRTEIAALQLELGVTTIYVTHDQVEAMTMGDRIALMKDGLLQQVSEPQEMYENPANIFVAGFIGSPPMNMALARLVRDGDGLVVDFGSQRVAVDPARVAELGELENWVDREVVVGVRHEDMEDAALERLDDGRQVSATVRLVEALGSELQVHFTFDAKAAETEHTRALAAENQDEASASATLLGHEGVRWIASFSPRSKVRVGDRIAVHIDSARMHFFDPQTSAAIRSRVPAGA
ncbi:carbohydrate ABC transporter ATP-binding protein, CUT1 family [Raineyella antarctica]|uniref:Carbohydrate ABC transporter ATP-binding protein, CUT1 family n=1 Tax=Raineyella antarctica TaxID=1577474 RepID=A0A1G6GH94_9ACTN|nr:sn-glycerol-3-phosphate ABC transporter ATP-binding protein UgpC [Raineyella antarctica]SDB81320.1 carbohydrate ABC transporter ATP-binding protein, CUT1 family [Raineyella antarctica]